VGRASTAVASLGRWHAVAGAELARYEAEYGDRGERLAALGSGVHHAYGRLGDIASRTYRFDGVVRRPLHQ
jgi:hypothetical protein